TRPCDDCARNSTDPAGRSSRFRSGRGARRTPGGRWTRSCPNSTAACSPRTSKPSPARRPRNLRRWAKGPRSSTSPGSLAARPASRPRS
ncbi:MAG: hypothetical protein ACK56I_21145, partial [bacterium]